MVIFGGFNDEFNNDMFYCYFEEEVDTSKIDPWYIPDTLNSIDNPFRSDLHFIIEPGYPNLNNIVFSHSYMFSK